MVEGRAISRRKYCSNACRDRNYAAQSIREVKLTQEQLDGKNCLNCGGVIIQTAGKPVRMYCDRNCARQFYYNTSPEEHAAIRRQVLEARKPVPGTPKEYRQIYVCKCCGKEFEGYKYRRRVYCSRECNNASHSYAGSKRQVPTEEICLSPSSAAYRAAKEMGAAGKKDREIADTLGCNIGTVQGWLRNTRHKTTPAQHRPFSEPFYRYIHARSAVEWIAVLNDEMRCTQGDVCAGNETRERSVILVCQTVHARRPLYALAAIVESGLGLDPLDGNIYAFCGITREDLIYFRWDGGGFQLTKRNRAYGRYVWPGEKLAQSIAVTPAEFAFILYGSQQKECLENR
jgi:hypothetical protein